MALVPKSRIARALFHRVAIYRRWMVACCSQPCVRRCACSPKSWQKDDRPRSPPNAGPTCRMDSQHLLPVGTQRISIPPTHLACLAHFYGLRFHPALFQPFRLLRSTCPFSLRLSARNPFHPLHLARPPASTYALSTSDTSTLISLSCPFPLSSPSGNHVSPRRSRGHWRIAKRGVLDALS